MSDYFIDRINQILTRYRVTTVDVRSRQPSLESEQVVVDDARRLDLPDASFDMVTSLCALEHFGLGRYGDELDEDGDVKGMAEFIRVVKPGGRLVFSTTITRGHAAIVFNAHRIYSRNQINELCGGIACEEEQFFSTSLHRACTFDEVTGAPEMWDVCVGCWRKPGGSSTT